MDFIPHQLESARTLRLLRFAYPFAIAGVVLVGNAVVLLVWRFLFSDTSPPYSWLLFVTLVTGGLSVVATGLERRRLLSSSAEIAAHLGARPLDAGVLSLSPLERRAIDLLEETALSARQPIPRLHVLEDERLIDALSIGLSRDDEAVVLTRAAIDRLDRDELRGVFAHQVARLASGHVRVDSQLGSMRFGLDLMARTGRCVMGDASVRDGTPKRGRWQSTGPVMMVPGILLLAVGLAGRLAADLLDAMARRPEFAADELGAGLMCSPVGLAGAMRKIRWMVIEDPAAAAPVSHGARRGFGDSFFLAGREREGWGTGGWLTGTRGKRRSWPEPALAARVERLLGAPAGPVVAERSYEDDAFLRQSQPREIERQARAGTPAGNLVSERIRLAQPWSGQSDALARDERLDEDVAALVAASRDVDSAAALIALLTGRSLALMDDWPIPWQAAGRFQENEAAMLRRLPPEELESLRLPLLELCAKELKPLEPSRKQALLEAMLTRIQSDPDASPAEWIRYVLMHDRLLPNLKSAYRPAQGDLDAAVAVRWMIALLARSLGEPDLRAERVSNEIIQSLGLSRTGQSFPGLDVSGLQAAVASLQRLPMPQRPVLLGCFAQFLPPEARAEVREFLHLFALLIDCRMPEIRPPLSDWQHPGMSKGPDAAASASAEIVA